MTKIRCGLSDTEKEEARQDIRKILTLAPGEVVGVRDALMTGTVEGRVYAGDCCCLVGTIAKLRGISVTTQAWFYPLERAIRFDEDRPAEEFFRHIHRGHTPENNQYAALALRWVDEWIDEQAGLLTFATEAEAVTA